MAGYFIDRPHPFKYEFSSAHPPNHIEGLYIKARTGLARSIHQCEQLSKVTVEIKLRVESLPVVSVCFTSCVSSSICEEKFLCNCPM